jgi:hypothetical protein
MYVISNKCYETKASGTPSSAILMISLTLVIKMKASNSNSAQLSRDYHDTLVRFLIIKNLFSRILKLIIQEVLPIKARQ